MKNIQKLNYLEKIKIIQNFGFQKLNYFELFEIFKNKWKFRALSL